LWVTEGTVEKHVRSILTKLNLAETDDDHRQNPAVERRGRHCPTPDPAALSSLTRLSASLVR
jgi:hypothetical protein